MPSWRLRAPERLVYIGQTRNEILKRMNQHNREFIWIKKFCTQLFDLKFHRGGNEC